MSRRPVPQFATGPQQCYRCGKMVYPTEKIGPVNEAVFHKNCFRCTVCGLTLSLSSYCANHTDSADREVYCSSHKPQLKNTQLDVDTVGLRSALTAQSLYNRSRDRDADVHRGGQVDAQAISIRQAVALTRTRNDAKDAGAGARSRVPALELDSVGIQSAVRAQRLRAGQKATYSRHHFVPGVAERRRQELLEAQKVLEQRHRAEEDRLLRVMMEERQLREQQLAAEMSETWEMRLQEMTQRRMPEAEKEVARQTIRFKEAEQRGIIESHFQELAQEKTAELVARQSQEMLQLLAKKQREMRDEENALVAKETAAATPGEPLTSDGHRDLRSSSAGIGSQDTDLADRQTQFRSGADRSASTADQMTQSDSPGRGDPHTADRTTQWGQLQLLTIDSASDTASQTLTEDSGAGSANLADTQQSLGLLSFIPDRLPSPCAPSRPKDSLYTDAGIFGQLDEHVIRIAEGGQQLTFTELAEQLTANCMSELEKVRAIFRWITVKDLSTLLIDNQSSPDTPMGLLRGIQYGTETYHVLFMRLCSYAGIHAVEIRGYSKSVGYEPCMQLRNAHKYKNIWNAVFIDGDWRLVQCSWAARHIVFNRNQRGSTQPVAAAATPAPSSENLRYYYDEHYFLTDPEKFIYEFFPFEPRWQLLEPPISLTDFEELPFIRSTFFHYGMEFPAGTKAALEANEFGGAALEISLRDPDLPLICHYQFTSADTGSAHYQGSHLDRYVFFSVPTPGSLMFDVHVPSKQPHYLEIFAAVVEPNSPALYGNQVRLKSVAKLKVTAAALQKRMNPLPQTSNATGEWGPTKALRHFHIKPMNHASAVINFDPGQSPERELTIEMWVPDSVLHAAASFSALLHKNGLSAQALSRFARISLQGNVLLLRVRPPEAGVYALELYLERAGHQPTHVCKYLVRCVNLPETALSRAVIDEQKVKPGPNGSVVKRLGVACASPEATKFKATVDTAWLPLRFSFKDDLDFIVVLSRMPAPDARPQQIQQQLVEDHSDNCEIRVAGQTATLMAHFVADGRYQLHLLTKRAGDATGFELCYTFRLDVTLPKAAVA